MEVTRLKVRNLSHVPYLQNEGMFLCPMPTPPPAPEGKIWYAKLKPYERLFYHQTLSSVRQCKRFVPTPEIPRDSLDFQLQSRYDHAREAFPEKVDAVMQRETCPVEGPHECKETFRLLRNTKTVNIVAHESITHPLKIGGIREKISPHSVKLINSGPHNQLVNNGFSRQPADGNFFRY